MKHAVLVMPCAAWVLAACVGAHAGGAVPREPAAWDGAPRSSVVALLGEPDKVKRQAGGREVLTYRLTRLGPEAIPGLGQHVVDVPGVGPCVTRTSHPDPSVKETTTFEPTAVDESGRPVAGGLTTTQSKTVAWGEDGKREGAAAPPPVAAGGKVKLQLILGADGRVEDWSLSPKR